MDSTLEIEKHESLPGQLDLLNGVEAVGEPSLLTNNQRWEMVNADCIEYMATMPCHCVDFSIFSPPFPSLFSYTDSEADIGNSESFKGDAKLHLQFFANQLFRLIKPGRVVIVHVQQIAALKRNGESSTVDFRGLMIRIGKRAGFIYDNDWTVSKNPQSQAIRTRSRKLQFQALQADRAQLAPAFNDYLIKFRAPGDNAVPIIEHEPTRTEWIEWAEGIWDWHAIRETDTLNTAAAKSDSDTRHICPLQLGVIERNIRLFSNPNEIVFSPFAGIGSEGFKALLLNRRFFGVELKQEYFEAAKKNLARAERKESEQLALFGVEE